jgi:alcohol dehydrogenase
MLELKNKAKKLIKEFKGKNYIHGLGCLDKIGGLTKGLGTSVFLVSSLHHRDAENFEILSDSLAEAGVQVVGHTLSARPNSPHEDVFRIKDSILESKPECVLTASGGSGIDATKAAIVLASLGGDLEDYFGLDRVTGKLQSTDGRLLPLVAFQTASGSSAHLTKYSNITDIQIQQKKLIIDEAIVPPRCLFDYSLTRSMSPSFTCDGAFDGLAHCLEVYYGAQPTAYAKIEEITLTGIELILAYLEKTVASPQDLEGREALGLATDLGGYAIMLGGTNGAHLTSFSLVDVLSHGRACALLNPYYTVFFSPAIQDQLQRLSTLLRKYDLIQETSLSLRGRELGVVVAQGLIALSKRVDFPTTLTQIEGLNSTHIEKAIQAAKNPQLASKLKNMPVPMTAEMVDEYMRPVMEAAMTGDFNLVKTID